MIGYIYILHFDEPLRHARHYAGCCHNLKARLIRHANGSGSNLCRVLNERGISWRLGALMSCSHAQMRRLERQLKDLANSPDYCEYCNPERTRRLPDCQPISIDVPKFPTWSESLRVTVQTGQQISCRFTSPNEPPTTMKRIRDLMYGDKDALGFIPTGGTQGMQIIFDRGLVCVVANNDEDVGYAAFTINPSGTQLNIHQCVVADDARLCGHGQALVEYIACRFPRMRLVAKVRDDLAANWFWQSIGFTIELTKQHKTSGSTIHHYAREPKGA